MSRSCCIPVAIYNCKPVPISYLEIVSLKRKEIYNKLHITMPHDTIVLKIFVHNLMAFSCEDFEMPYGKEFFSLCLWYRLKYELI